MESPPKRSCSVVSPCNPLSVWSVGPQIALGIDPGKPSEEIACAEAIEAPSNRPGNAAVATANNLTSSCLFIIPPCHVSALPASVAHIGRSTRFSSEELQTQFTCSGAVGKKRGDLTIYTLGWFSCRHSFSCENCFNNGESLDCESGSGHALNAPTIREAGKLRSAA